MKSRADIENEIAQLECDIAENNQSIKMASQVPDGHQAASRVIDTCTVNNLASRCRIDALQWVIEP